MRFPGWIRRAFGAVAESTEPTEPRVWDFRQTGVGHDVWSDAVEGIFHDIRGFCRHIAKGDYVILRDGGVIRILSIHYEENPFDLFSARGKTGTGQAAEALRILSSR